MRNGIRGYLIGSFLFMLTISSVFASESGPSAVGFVFSGAEGALARLACGGKADRCFLKLDHINPTFDGKALYMYADRSGSEWHLSTKEIDRFATVYVSEGRAYQLTVWKTKSGKRLDLKRNDAKTEQFEADSFYKASLGEQ